MDGKTVHKLKKERIERLVSGIQSTLKEDVGKANKVQEPLENAEGVKSTMSGVESEAFDGQIKQEPEDEETEVDIEYPVPFGDCDGQAVFPDSETSDSNDTNTETVPSSSIKNKKQLSKSASSHLPSRYPASFFTGTQEEPKTLPLLSPYLYQSANVEKQTETKKQGPSGGKFFECDICLKKFNKSSNMTRHRQIHTGEKLYECDICMKKFMEVSKLNRHKRIHIGDKPFQCDICKKNFRDGSYLNVHKRIHSGEKPFECEVCKKKFNDLSNLNTHKRIHTGDKPYQCFICMKKFIHASHLNKHKRSHSRKNILDVIFV